MGGTAKMVKLFSLLLILGLALSPPARAEDEAEEAEAGGDEKEAEDDIELVEAPEEDGQLEEKDEVLKKGVEAAKKGGDKMRGAFSTTKVTGKRIFFGSKRIKSFCGCGGGFERPTFEDLLDKMINEGKVKKEDEMVMIIRTKDGVKYRFKGKSDLKKIYYVQHKHGRWPEWKTIDFDDFAQYTGYSIIQFELNHGVQVFGIVKGNTVIAHEKIDLMQYVVTRMWLNYLASRANEKHPIKTIEVTWKGKKYTNWPQDHPEFLVKPFFLPERNRRVYWVIVKMGDQVQVIPRQPHSTVEYIKWPSFSFPSIEWHFPKLPDTVFENLCFLDEMGKHCVDSGDHSGGNSDVGDKSVGSISIEPPDDSDIIVSTLPGEFSLQGHQGCSCQKWCKCTSGGPYKKRQKRSHTADSYKQFMQLTKDCVSERRCRKAYSKFMKHGLIKVKSD